MKIYLTCLLSIGITLAFAQKQPPVILSNTNSISIRDGDFFMKGGWTLAPQYKPDVYTTYVKGKKQVTFYTDLDSISFNVKRGDTFDFIILHNGTDSCYTRVEGKKEVPATRFTKRYKENNRGLYTFEVPEVQELVHIIMALTPTGIADSNLVDHNGTYYQDVMAHFGDFKKEPVVAVMEEMLSGNLYPNVKMDACGFYFKGKKIKKDRYYDRINWGKINYIDELVPALEDFAAKTEFRQFYTNHQAYYNELMDLMEKQTPIRQQWTWLEERFENRYDHYRITFSPLVNGSHSTNGFITDDFKQTMMFICGPVIGTDLSEAIKEGLMTRVVFTEIDHNYVNPVSLEYLNEINEIFDDRVKWTIEGSSAQYYPNPFSVFNEYMTWAVFTLYAKDHFSESDFNDINHRVIVQMEDWRGFSNYGAFNEEVLRIYEKEKNIEKIYPVILDWCSKQ